MIHARSGINSKFCIDKCHQIADTMATEQHSEAERIQAAQELFSALHQLPITKDRKESVERDLFKLVVPSELQNIGADQLKKQSFDAYIFDTSLKLQEARERRALQVTVRKVDEDLLPGLEKNWKELKQFNYKLLETRDGNGNFLIDLTW